MARNLDQFWSDWWVLVNELDKWKTTVKAFAQQRGTEHAK